MKIINTVQQWKLEFKNLENKKIGFVPTMGGLHKGHLSLIKRSKDENDISVVSVYLNPTQFNDKNDLITYPANFEDDIKFLENAAVDYLFAPSYEVMYPDDFKYKVTECDFSKKLCGEKRPGHFDGVLTVVMKLFNIIKPQNAYFGEKDFQQFKLLQGMAKAFFLDINIVSCPIVREDSGLAVSSRNKKLSQDGMKKACLLNKILISNNSIVQKEKMLNDSGFTVDYISEVDNRLYAAAFLEGVRLIDNVEISECNSKG